MKSLKFSLIILFIISMSTVSKAQLSFNHNYGFGLLLSNSGGPTIEYSPRLNIVQFGDEASLSIGTHLALCAFMIDGEGIYGFSAPIMGEFNFGLGSGPDSYANIGGFVGAGFAYSMLNDFDGYQYNKAMGPIFNAGISGYFFGNPMGLRVSYQQNTNIKYLSRGYSDAITIGIYIVVE